MGQILIANGIGLQKRILNIQREAVIAGESNEWILFLNELTLNTYYWEMAPIKVMKSIKERASFDVVHQEQLNDIKELILHSYMRHPDVPQRMKDDITTLDSKG